MVYFLIKAVIALFVSLIASVQDFKRGRVNNFLLWGGIFAAVLCQLCFFRLEFWTYLAGGLFCAGVFLFARFVTNKKLGLADVYFAGFAGVVLKWQLIWIFMLSSIFFALIFMLFKMLINRLKNSNHPKIFGKMPFIPFLSFGLICALAVEILGKTSF